MESHSLKKIKITVFGASGQLGCEFRHVAPSWEFMKFSFYTRDEADISDSSSVQKAIAQTNPDYIINCAAYTAVDKAESDIDRCYAINAHACTVLCDALLGTNIRLIHFSSDYVYHTYNGFPLRENDETRPAGVYAMSKLEGEMNIRKSGTEALIIRTSWVISSFGNNFVKTMLRLGSERSELNVVNDQFGAPTYARHLANLVLDVITQIETDESKKPFFNETYNFANEGMITWFNLASQIMKDRSLACKINPIPSSGFPTPAGRPSWSVLSKHKIKLNFGIEVPHWHVALSECLEAIHTDLNA